MPNLKHLTLANSVCTDTQKYQKIFIALLYPKQLLNSCTFNFLMYYEVFLLFAVQIRSCM